MWCEGYDPGGCERLLSACSALRTAFNAIAAVRMYGCRLAYVHAFARANMHVLPDMKRRDIKYAKRSVAEQNVAEQNVAWRGVAWRGNPIPPHPNEGVFVCTSQTLVR